jgi:alpha-beta hydrolase superfamily lysophospholipase
LVAAIFLAGCAASHAPAQPARAADAPTVDLPTGQFNASGGVTLPMRRYAATVPRKVVLLALHGFNDYSRFISEAAHYFAQHGVETIAYDQRGFGGASDRGQWSGADAMAADFLAVLADVRRDYPGVPVFALGESMGASVIAIALSRAPQAAVDGVDGVILATPAVWSRDTMPWYQRFGIWAGAKLAPRFTISSTKFDITPSDNRAMRTETANDPLIIKETRLDKLDGLTDLMELGQQATPQLKQRALLLYGLRDVMMPRRPLIALFERWPTGSSGNYRYVLYPDGYHVLMRDLQRKVVWDDVLSWMLRPGAALPSGLERQRAQVLPLLRSD